MRSSTIRLSIFISTVVISAIIVFQLIWLKNVYNFEQKQFDHAIAQSIRGYYEDIRRVPDPAMLLSDQIARLNSETYIVKADKPFNFDSVAFYMKQELEEQNIFTDCYIAIYDSKFSNYVFKAYLPPTATSRAKEVNIPKTPETYSHITLYFPNRNRYILSLMNFWLISSALLLLVLILFGGSLYYFYRQKFLNETQKDFVNNFTHEFKTPVAIINLAAEVLGNPELYKRPERLSRYADIVKYQGKYLQEQIERLLKFAYSESNLLHLEKEKLNFHHLIREAVHNLQPLIEEKNASIEYELDANHDILFADHGYLLIVITNLIENGLKYAEKPQVVIRTLNENGNLILTVKDNGKGIEKKYHDKIFQKFFRIPTGDQVPARGFGLGLAFVKRIVTAHSGKIKVESEPSIGSNFIVTLPILH
ncbi:MAG TPA: HAMP domain-containing sensor histidine kinase [Flavisolibacter sp.]|nr:HAMP domain-containing sensor histidine kinase [Flavisolibacter sp.]